MLRNSIPANVELLKDPSSSSANTGPDKVISKSAEMAASRRFDIRDFPYLFAIGTLLWRAIYFFNCPVDGLCLNTIKKTQGGFIISRQ